MLKTNYEQFKKLLLETLEDLTMNFGKTVNATYFLKSPLHEIIRLASAFPYAQVMLSIHLKKLIQAGGNINHIDHAGNSLMSLCLMHKLPSPWVNYLVANGIHLNKHKHDHPYVFSIAVKNGYAIDVIKMLVEETQLQIKSLINRENQPESEKEAAIKNIMNCFVIELIINHAPSHLVKQVINQGADLTVPLLHLDIHPLSAIINSLSEMNLDRSEHIDRFLTNLDLLIEHGADVNESNSEGITPMHQIMSFDKIDTSKKVIEKLLKHGANINVPDMFSNTPLHMLSDNFKRPKWDIDKITDLTEFMIQNNADIFLTDIEGDRTPFYLMFMFLYDEPKYASIKRLLTLFHQQGVNFFSINPSTQSIYFRGIEEKASQAMLEISVEHIINNPEINVPIKEITNAIFEPIYKMHHFNGKVKMRYFLNTLIKYNVKFDDAFIQRFILLKNNFSRETICDDADILATIIKNYQSSNMVVYNNNIAKLCKLFDGQYTKHILKHAVAYILNTSDAKQCQTNLLTLFSLLVHTLMIDQPEKIIAYIEILENIGVHINDFYIQTFIDFKSVKSENINISDAAVVKKLLSIYEPSDDQAYQKNLNKLIELSSGNETKNIVKFFLTLIQKESLGQLFPVSYYKIQRKINNNQIGKNDITEILESEKKIMTAIKSHLHDKKFYSVLISPVIKRIVESLKSRCALSKMFNIPDIAKHNILQFLPEADLVSTIQAANLFYKKPTLKRSLAVITPANKRIKTNKENQTPHSTSMFNTVNVVTVLKKPKSSSSRGRRIKVQHCTLQKTPH